MSAEAQLTTSHPIRCFCSRQPLLATYGITADGKAYVHVKVYKQRRIYGNVLITDGNVAMQCRECLRWYRVEIISDHARLTEVVDISTVADADPVLVSGGPAQIERAKVADQDD